MVVFVVVVAGTVVVAVVVAVVTVVAGAVGVAVVLVVAFVVVLVAVVVVAVAVVVVVAVVLVVVVAVVNSLQDDTKLARAWPEDEPEMAAGRASKHVRMRTRWQDTPPKRPKSTPRWLPTALR